MARIWFKVVTLFIGVAILAFFLGTALRHKRPETTFSDQQYIELFPKVKALISREYVDKVDERKLLEGAISGMLASLDPHSAYLPPDFFKELNIEITGSFGGLGMEVSMTDGRLTVIAPIDDTPAYRAGIKAGDFIWKIDGKATSDLTINEAVKRMRGAKGTAVTLTIIRKNLRKPLELSLVRNIITTHSLKSRTLEKGYGYVRISHFQQHTGEEFAAALAALQRENGNKLRGLVIDLRNNPGGLLESAVSVAGCFIDNKADKGLIVYTKGRDEASRMTLTADAGHKEPGYPIVVLINGGSASASEIVAGALQDHRRGVIMGTQSFGKGSVQTIFPLPGGGGLKLTTARYYTPKGRSIQSKGITPDIIVESGEVVSKAEEEDWDVREKDLNNHLTTGDEPPPLATKPQPVAKVVRKPAADLPLDRALSLLKGAVQLGGKP